MKNKIYWVVSPNVKNNEEEHLWKDFISDNPYSFIGWGAENKIGNNFINDGYDTHNIIPSNKELPNNIINTLSIVPILPAINLAIIYY